MSRIKCVVLGLTILAASTPLIADDLTGSSAFLCTVARVNVCEAEGECESMPPWALNVPQFIEVDLDKKTLSTTRASGENRSTPIKNLERDGGMIILQGVEQGRAFSFAITEATGMASIAVAREDRGVVGFGPCTPLPGSR